MGFSQWHTVLDRRPLKHGLHWNKTGHSSRSAPRAPCQVSPDRDDPCLLCQDLRHLFSGAAKDLSFGSRPSFAFAACPGGMFHRNNTHLLSHFAPNGGATAAQIEWELIIDLFGSGSEWLYFPMIFHPWMSLGLVIRRNNSWGISSNSADFKDFTVKIANHREFSDWQMKSVGLYLQAKTSVSLGEGFPCEAVVWVVTNMTEPVVNLSDTPA